MIKVGIAGGAGYTAGELIRLLLHHPHVHIASVSSSSQAGRSIADVHTDLLGDMDLTFTDRLSEEIDVLFLCMGHGESRKFLEENETDLSVKIIDLSQDFRHKDNHVFRQRQFVYGLPELHKKRIASANSIANPGCFATAIQLGLLPLFANGFTNPIFSTGITGATGAGQSPNATSHFSWRVNNIQAYKSLQHQHVKEITETLSSANPSHCTPVIHFIPWRGDFARGIFVSQQFETDRSLEELYEMYHDFYGAHPFVKLSKAPIHLKQAVNTNKCILQIEKTGAIAVVHSVIDNLLKGASGQAVQNMNIMCGLDEAEGLTLKATAF